MKLKIKNLTIILFIAGFVIAWATWVTKTSYDSTALATQYSNYKTYNQGSIDDLKKGQEGINKKIDKVQEAMDNKLDKIYNYMLFNKINKNDGTIECQ